MRRKRPNVSSALLLPSSRSSTSPVSAPARWQRCSPPRARSIGARLTVDYRELPDAVWTRIAPFLGVELGDGEIALLREEARYHAKDPVRRLFTGDAPEQRAPSDALRALAAEYLEPLYGAPPGA